MFHNFYKYKCNYSIEMFYQGFKSELSFLKKKCQPNFHRAWTTGHCAWCVCAVLCVCEGGSVLKKKKLIIFYDLHKKNVQVNDLNEWLERLTSYMFPDACFVCCHRERTAKEKNRGREAKNNRSVLLLLFNLQTVPNFSNYQAAKQTEASRQELAVSCSLHFGGSCLIWGKTWSISCTNTSRANTPLPARPLPFNPYPHAPALWQMA